MDCPGKFHEAQLPPIGKVYISLNNENVSEEEYENAQEIWTTFEVKDLQEFTSVYNKVDLLRLADIMGKFRDISLKTYKLDPTWYYIAPGFAWDCMLKMIKQRL